MKQKISNRTINEDGSVILNDEALFESLFINPKSLNNTAAGNTADVVEYNKWAKIYDLPTISERQVINHEENQSKWSMPQKYKDLDIERHVIERCQTDEQMDRCVTELGLFKERDLYDLLRYMVYIVDIMRENNIVWGVGRGSSVSSYVLYLIGVHKVDSLLYALDISEFLK